MSIKFCRSSYVGKPSMLLQTSAFTHSFFALHTEPIMHGHLCKLEFLHRDTLYTEQFYTQTFYHRSRCTELFLHTKVLHTETFVYTRFSHTIFCQGNIYTYAVTRKVFAQTLLRTDRLVNTRFPQKFSHIPVFTQIFVTYTSLTQSFRYTDYLTHGSFYRQEVLYINVFFAQKFLHEENFTQKQSLGHGPYTPQWCA